MSDKPLPTLIVEPYSNYGGAEMWLLKLLDATDRLDARAVLLKDGPMRQALEHRGVPVELHPVGRNPWDIPPAALWLARRLRALRPSVVLGNTVKAQIVAAPAGRIAGVPTVWAKHDHSYDRTLAVPLGRASTKVIGAVEELAQATRRPDAVIVPPPRPDDEPAGRGEARWTLAARGIPLDDRPTLVMAGRLVPFKGVDDAIEALTRPAAADWRLVVAGDDDYASPHETERLRALAAARGVSERVHFAGQVPGVSHWLSAFDALAVLTKRSGRRSPHGEGFGTSAFEAMLAGVPVIAAGGGAVVRRLQDGRAGITVPPGDPHAVAAALGRLADPAVRAHMGAAARAIVADHPDVHECAALLVRTLREAAAAR